MQTLRRQALRGVAAGEPLPAPWPIMLRAGALIRRDSVSMVGGRPGSMKTMFILNMMHQMKVPTLYFSSDSGVHTVATRMLSMLTGTDSEETEKWLKSDPVMCARILGEVDYVKWCFESNPSMDTLWDEADAFAEIHGAYPKLTVIDILMDFDHEGAPESYWRAMGALKDFARQTETAVLIAHHTSIAVDGDPVQPESAIMGKATQAQSLIINVAVNQAKDRFFFAVVKNRHGKSDNTGGTYYTLAVNPDACRIAEIPEAPQPSDVPILFRDGPSVPKGQKIR